MLMLVVSAMRLSVRFAQLGGMAGTAVFLVQGEFLKALECILISCLCITLLALAMRFVQSLGHRAQR